jgi:hypothetical protein
MQKVTKIALGALTGLVGLAAVPSFAGDYYCKPYRSNSYCAPKYDYCPPRYDYCPPKYEYCAPRYDYYRPVYKYQSYGYKYCR